MFACSRDSIKCVELLLKYHANVNIRNRVSLDQDTQVRR